MMLFTSNSLEETVQIGKKISSFLKVGSVVCLSGELGAGKTTLVKAIASLFTNEEIISPTYTYLNIYDGSIPLYHFDLYRLTQPEEFLFSGFDEFLHKKGICLIEWSDRLPSLEIHKIKIEISYNTSLSREIRVHV